MFLLCCGCCFICYDTTCNCKTWTSCDIIHDIIRIPTNMHTHIHTHMHIGPPNISINLNMEQDWETMVRRHKSQRQGYLQREKAQVEYAEAPYSHLAKYLLEAYGFGELSSVNVQQLAMMAKLDGLKHTSVEKLAGLCTTCKHTQNSHRDLLIYMKSNLHPIVPIEPDCVHKPLKIPKGPKS